MKSDLVTHKSDLATLPLLPILLLGIPWGQLAALAGLTGATIK